MTGSAAASHGKVGLWNMTVTMSSGHAMPDLSKLPPEVQARMRAMGVTAGGSTITMQHCMTQSEVSVDMPHMDEHTNKSCKMNNLKITPYHMSADMICSGAFTGTGHMDYVFEGDTHYTGTVDMSGMASGGQVMHNRETIDGRWLSADCGGLKH
jgi:hypothetical protein